MAKQYIMLKCIACGHLFKSNVNTQQTRCSKCGKSSFLQVDKINESVCADIEILKQQFQIISDRLASLEGKKSEPTPQPEQAGTSPPEPVEPDQDRPLTQLEKMKAKFGE